MRQRFPRPRVALWLVIYAVCLLCVVSFVLFEVLDVDGSDFPRVPNHLSIKLAESEHQDVKRLVLGGGGVVPALAMAVVARPLVVVATRMAPGLRRRPPPLLTRTPRVALARVLLSDAPPSA